MNSQPALFGLDGAWLAAFAVLAALTAVLAVSAFALSRRLADARVRLTRAETLAQETEALKGDLEAERARNARLEREGAAMEARLAERERALAELKARLDSEFRAAASQMLKAAHEDFLQRANETFERHREAASAEAERKRKALDELIRPMAETLGRYEASLAEMRADQQKARGELIGRMSELASSAEAVRAEARKLATALRSGAKVRGRWGEEQLRNVVEIAGMAAYVDFVEQKSHDDGERRKQPDMIVNLPGGRKIAVDSKVSINAYLDALEADTDAKRASCLARHGEDLWAHVKALSAKDYAAGLKDSLDIVVMFVPGENYFAAAVEARPQLFQEAFERKVLIATPTTLLAMLKAASFTWRQEKAAENAAAVARMAKDLYDSLRVMGGHLAALGKALESAVGKYNAAVGAIEQRVMPRARRFADYELPGIDGTIDPLKEAETPVRALREDRDLLLPELDPDRKGQSAL